MKKIVSLILLVLILFVATSCGDTASGDLISKLPSSVKTIAYLNVENAMKIEMIKPYIEREAYGEIIKNFKEVVIGIGDINPNMNFVSIDASDVDKFVVLLSGQYKKDDIVKIIKAEMNTEDMKIGDIDGQKGKEGTVLFISNSIIAITSLGFEEEVISSVREGKNLIDTKSNLYKNAKASTSNLMWVVGDLTVLGQRSLGLSTFTDPVTFGEFNFGLSEKDKAFDITASVNVDTEKAATSISSELNIIISTAPVLIGPFIPDKEIKDEINTLIKNFKLNAKGNNISTGINIPFTFIDKLIKIAPSIMGSMGSF